MSLKVRCFPAHLWNDWQVEIEQSVSRDPKGLGDRDSDAAVDDSQLEATEIYPGHVHLFTRVRLGSSARACIAASIRSSVSASYTREPQLGQAP